MYVNEKSKSFARVARQNHRPIRLPEDGHLNDFQGTSAHNAAAKYWIPNLELLAKDHQKEIIRAIGYIGRIAKIDDADGTVLLACACGAHFLANINDFVELNVAPTPDKIRRM